MFADDLLLFAEASVEQIQEICSVLSSFCDASGQKVSAAKTVIYFSKNVSPEDRAHIASIGGFTTTNDLGKYLGIPIVHGRVRRGTFRGVVDRVRLRLQSWAASTLSLAGRTTLVQSVIQAIPTYSMHVLRLPSYVCREIDQCCRNFIWGHMESRRRIHLVNWTTLTLPRSRGGLGLRRIHEFNTALLGKLGWGLISRPNELCSRVLLSKYRNRITVDWGLSSRAGDSWLWKMISGAWNDVRHLMGWSLGNGNRVRFWTDRWLSSGSPIVHNTTLPVPMSELNRPVRDYVAIAGSWNWSAFATRIDNGTLLRIASTLPPPLSSQAPDHPVIFGSRTGEYSVSTVYSALAAVPNILESPLWKAIWRWEGPNRIRYFLWLVSHKRLLTNEERHRRHMANSAACPHCPTVTESILHVLRDCFRARKLWCQLVPQQFSNAFFSSELDNWVHLNLSRPPAPLWPQLFAVGCWMLWSWRNKLVFQPDFVCPPDVAAVVRRTSDSFVRAWKYSAPLTSKPARIWSLIGWTKPFPSQFKLNTDGASRGNPGLAAAGGLIRDSSGSWITGFMHNLGHGTSVLAELWGVASGLDIAWDGGCRNLVVEVDSKVVLDMIMKKTSGAIIFRSLLQRIEASLMRDWVVNFRHTYREGNSCADWLARQALSQPLGLHICQSIPSGLYPLLIRDVMGASMPRLVLAS